MTMFIKITDGLGNQMFQYAFAYFLQEKYKETVKLDVSSFPYNTYRDLGIDKFTLLCSFADEKELPAPTYIHRRNTLFNFLRSKLSNPRYYLFFSLFEYLIDTLIFKYAVHHFVRQKTIWFLPAYLTTKGEYYSGYRQFTNHLPAIRQKLLSSFTLKKSLDKKNAEIVHQMQWSNSVALHIRRGDYTQGRTPRRHPMYPCSLSYYQEAIAYLTTRLKNLTFFVFSDDFLWVKNNLQLPKQTQYIDRNKGKDTYKDLRLMSKCKHNIISNSTLSWRGAYLNTNPDNLVIAPKHRYAKNEKASKSLIPDTRITL